ncbi:MAG: hypothetical protein AAGD92_06470 [Pseudomonadota bacterium]
MSKSKIISTQLKVALPAIAACLSVTTAMADTVAQHSHKHGNETATRKPGAAVTFKHALRDKVSPNGAGVITLTVDNAYGEGTLSLEAKSAKGLRLATRSQSTQFDMSGAKSQEWDIYFNAGDAGVYYIDVGATVIRANSVVGVRNYSIRVDVGANPTLRKPATGMRLQQNASGDAVVVMEAVETIEE